MYDITLIVPTYGRYRELEMFLDSIANQSYDLKKIEVIIVDQNDTLSIDDVIKRYQNLFTVIHKKTSVKGIANAKNVGIKLSSAPVITFPDDDCMYYNDTIFSALNFFNNTPEIDMIYGKVYDRENKINIMRNWSNEKIHLNLYNFHLNYSAITCFTKNKELLFDTTFGVGAKFSSGEELDYVINAIKSGLKVMYAPQIVVWHPQLNLNTMPLQKIFNYAAGYGAICKKNSNFPIVFLFSKSVLNQMLLTLRYVVTFNKPKVRKHFTALKGRLSGFIQFKN